MKCVRHTRRTTQGCTVLCSAMQGRGWLLVGAGTDLFLPKAQGPEAAPPGSSQGKGKQRKSRDDLTDMKAR